MIRFAASSRRSAATARQRDRCFAVADAPPRDNQSRWDFTLRGNSARQRGMYVLEADLRAFAIDRNGQLPTSAIIFARTLASSAGRALPLYFALRPTQSRLLT